MCLLDGAAHVVGQVRGQLEGAEAVDAAGRLERSPEHVRGHPDVLQAEGEEDLQGRGDVLG